MLTKNMKIRYIKESIHSVKELLMQMLPHDLQEMIETEYSRHHVRTLIKGELKDTLMEPIYECIGRIQSWIKEDHYETKKNSLNYLDCLS